MKKGERKSEKRSIQKEKKNPSTVSIIHPHTPLNVYPWGLTNQSWDHLGPVSHFLVLYVYVLVYVRMYVIYLHTYKDTYKYVFMQCFCFYFYFNNDTNRVGTLFIIIINIILATCHAIT